MKEVRYDRSPACDQFELEMQACMEGEDRPFVAAHIRTCAFCSVTLGDLEALRAAARTLPRLEPPAVVWARIHAQLLAEGAFAEKKSIWSWLWRIDLLRRPIPITAFACLLLLGCWVTAPRTYLEPEWASGLGVSPSKPAVRSMGFAGDSGALEHVVRELEETFRARETSLAPDLRVTYENSLKSLDVSIRECSDSLLREPDNSLAHEYLLSAYSQKAQVLSSALEFDEGR